MKLYYHTGWSTASVHYCAHGGSSWKTLPMADVPRAPGWKVASLEDAAKGAEFVTCNGEGTQWDNPPASIGGQNYKTPELPGDWTLRQGRLMQISREKPIMIVSDLDHTMIGHEHDPGNGHLQEFLAQWLGRFAFNGSLLVYSTGRNKLDALSVAVERGLPRPALLICAVGTEVYQVPEDLPLDSSWAEQPERITLEPHWTKKMVETFDRIKVEAKLREDFPKFDVRGSPESDPFRIPTVIKVEEDFQDYVRQVREAVGPTVEVITSGGAEWKYVDFCSTQGGKMKGCQFAMEHLNIPADRTLVCGDSGNDESMFRAPGVRGVAVGNSLPELIEHLRNQATDPEAVKQGNIFDTAVGSRVLYATWPVAAAIVEALNRFWP